MKRLWPCLLVSFLEVGALLLFPDVGWSDTRLGGSTAPDGSPVQVDVPLRLRLKNVGGTDGAGLCVFSSLNMAALVQLEPSLYDFQAKMRAEKGGGWPEKVDQMIVKYGRSVDYAQYLGRDPAVIQQALASGRLPCVTYCGRDPHYKGFISHMVNCVHWDDAQDAVAILDNNYIGASELVWMTRHDFLERWAGKGSGWCVVLLRQPPDEPVQFAVGLPALQPFQPDYDTPPTYFWFVQPSDPGRVYLFSTGSRPGLDWPVGAFDVRQNYFRFCDRAKGVWLSATTPPFPVPALAAGQAWGKVGPVVTDYGVPLDLFPPRTAAEESWTRQGQAAARDTILGAMPPKKKNTDPLRPALPAPALIGAIVLMSLALRRSA